MLKKKLLSLILLSISIFNYGQCNGRYQTEIFNTVSVSTVNYSDVYNDFFHKMDIYTPDGDTVTNRPVILYMHGGAFYAGEKGSVDCVDFCTSYAKKGYVAIAMSYRQGWNPTSPSQSVRTATILQAAYRGIQDAKAMVRYMRKTVAEDGNAYGIDDTKIVLGGQGTGGYLSMGYITLDTVSELYLPKFMDLTTF